MRLLIDAATYWLQMRNKGPIVGVQWNNKAVAEVFGMRANRASDLSKDARLHPAQTPNARAFLQANPWRPSQQVERAGPV